MKPVLYISKRSPFARRIRLLLEELNFEHDIEILNVFDPPSSYFSVNPLGRVPVLKLATGECIIDSNQIFSYLKEKFREHPLFQTGALREAALLSYSGVAMGVIEIVINYFLEGLRPEGQRSPQDTQEYLGNIHKGLKYLEENIASQGPYYTGEVLRACDFDIGCALGYSTFRVGEQVLAGYPKLSAYFAKISARKDFEKTKPTE